MVDERVDWFEFFELDKDIIGCTGGKGGTGKTTVAVNIAYMLSKLGKKVLIIDCDVDNPNVSILMNIELKEIKKINIFVPEFNDKCISCKKCHDVCKPHAILHIPDKKPLLFPEICEGCAACQIICPVGAIDSGFKEIGALLEGSNYGIDIIVGRLKVGEPNSSEIVKQEKIYALKKIKENNYDSIIIDTAPGAHCDVFYSLFGSKIVLYVTEPTLYGMFDLKRILELVKVIDYPIKSYIILNRSDMTNRHDLIEKLSEEYSVPIIGQIPLDKSIQVAYAKGVPVIEEFPDSVGSKSYIQIFNKLKGELKKE
ncbi:MAG: P-loop NTPase [Candidatus Helarchaeota archaeon]